MNGHLCNIFLTAYMPLGVGIRFQKTLFSSKIFYICNINQLVPIIWFSVKPAYTGYCIVVKQISTKYCCLCWDGYGHCRVLQSFGYLSVVAILYLFLQMVQFLVNYWGDMHGLESQRVLEGSGAQLEGGEGEEGGDFPSPFSKNGINCPNLEKRYPDRGHLWVKFLI